MAFVNPYNQPSRVNFQRVWRQRSLTLTSRPNSLTPYHTHTHICNK